MRSLLFLAALVAQEKKEPPPPPVPRVVVCLPLGVSPGEKAKLTLRGLNLDQATEARFAAPVEGAEIKIKSKGKSAPPKDQDAAVYGDTQVELEVKLPAELPGGKLELVVVNPAGVSGPHELLVVPAAELVAEKEPNGGFVAAQPLESGRTVQGVVGQALDVDVFRVSGRAGEKWEFEVAAHRHGSPLDPILELRAGDGRLVASADDGAGTRDVTLSVTLPSIGAYYIVLVDAHHQGSASHVYHLRARRAP